MKTMMTLGWLLLAGPGMAQDLVFKTGFENRFLVAGSVTGLSSSPLTLSLISVSGNETLAINNNGRFVFELPVLAGHAWRVEVATLPSQPQTQSCALSQNSGPALPVGGVDDVQVDCQVQAWEWDVMDWDQGGWQ
ncbi:hypothetical protein [Marinicella meishanensis]|uniref:hypothetical protein n=1 Tax=Marinicella meishanensis TaxID=2873263 RepID=UPI001CBBDC36|nr:hypothetical protein [Marinicella sp. NBU2979]